MEFQSKFCKKEAKKWGIKKFANCKNKIQQTRNEIFGLCIKIRTNIFQDLLYFRKILRFSIQQHPCWILFSSIDGFLRNVHRNLYGKVTVIQKLSTEGELYLKREELSSKGEGPIRDRTVTRWVMLGRLMTIYSILRVVSATWIGFSNFFRARFECKSWAIFYKQLSFVKINIIWKYVFCKCNFDKSLDQNFWIATWVKTELISDSSGKAWSETEWTKFTWPSFCANELNQNWSNRAPEGLTGILCSNTFYDERSVGSKSETSRPVSRATCKTTPWRCVLSSCSFSILPSR